MMNVEVVTPTPHAWSNMCRPLKYGYDGPADEGGLYPWNVSSFAENLHWFQLSEKELSSRLAGVTQISQTLIPSNLSSIQIAGKSLLGQNKCASAGSSKCQTNSGNVQWYCDKFEDASLIPGLPEDVAQMCLALVRREDFPSVRKVCRAWWDLVHTREFYQTRKGVGTLEEWLYVLIVSEDQKGTRWEVLNPKQKGDWKVIPKMPGVTKLGSGTVVVNEKLVVIGGMVVDEETTSPSADVFIYDPVLDKWTKAASLKVARCEFGCGVLDGKVYVAGGHGPNGEALASMEVYDLEWNEWVESCPLKKPRWGCFAAGVEGKLYVMGGRCSFTLGSARHMDVFDPSTGKWSENKFGCAMVLTQAVVNGKIFCMEWKDDRSLQCFDTATNTWSKIALPLRFKKSRARFCLGTYGGKLQFFRTDCTNPAVETIVYDPDAAKGSEWQTTEITTRGICLSVATMTV